jgi:flagellar biosynthetic protein FlhB
MANDDQHKGEQATEFKLRQARERGSVARSMDINSFAILLMLAIGLAAWGQDMLVSLLGLTRALLSQAAMFSQAPAQFVQWAPGLLLQALLACLPLLLLVIAAAILSGLLQAGPVFSFFPLKPDWSRVNPLAGFKRVFTMRMVFDGIKCVFKATAMALATWLLIESSLPTLLGLGHSDIRRLPTVALAVTGDLVKWCVLSLLPLALLDLAWVRRDFLKKMMMSRREVTDEHKQREGDPRIRAQLRALQREARKRSQSLRNVRQADVLITNPTRLALALRYDSDTMSAPTVVAKGAGQLARMMRAMAFRHQVPVIENRKLARALFRETGIHSPIPQAFYPAVARLLLWVYAQRQKTAATGPKTASLPC